MPKFQITFTDPETQERVTREATFEDTPASNGRDGISDVAHGPISARYWAEDAAYTWRDKSLDYTIREMR